MAYIPDNTYKPKQAGKQYKRKEQKNWLKNKDHEAIYHSTRWRKLRAWYMANNPVCVKCTKPAKYLDHITPISQGGAIWEIENLQGLCLKCNAKKTRAQQNI